MFDDATRVPLLMSWPGVIRPGTKIEHVVSNVDLFPTLLDIAGPAGLIISLSAGVAWFHSCRASQPPGTTHYSASTTCTTTRWLGCG
jgi:Sulfatase